MEIGLILRETVMIGSIGENHSSSTTTSGSLPSSQTRSGAPVTGGTTATMTVTSPAWSGTSWTGGMAYGCTAALKTTGDGGKLLKKYSLFYCNFY